MFRAKNYFSTHSHHSVHPHFISRARAVCNRTMLDNIGGGFKTTFFNKQSMTNVVDTLSSNNNAKQASSSQLFRRNRAIGYVSNNIPAVTRYVRSRKDTLIATCIGRSFQVYTASHFRLIHVSGLHPDDITAMAIDRFFIYTASKKCIYVWKSGKHIKHILRGHERNVQLLMPFGRQHLIAIDEGNVLKVWEFANETVYLEIPFDSKEFKISAIAHLPTYVNKILLGSQQGQMQLWNIKNNKCIYMFAAHHNSCITCLTPAPALDVAAIGYQDGHIALINLKFDEILMEFKQDWGAVTQISFRTDGPPIMTTSSRNGHIAFWNLEERKIANQTQAHEEAVTTTICFPNEPLMLTTSPDNSMKLWIFDLPDGAARMLRIREGHTGPPLCIRYHGSSGNSILSSGEDGALRVFSTLSESLNKSMGKASYNRKASKRKNRFEVDTLRMPPIIEFTAETTREKEWDNIAAIHSGIIPTTTWSFHKNRMGEHRLLPQDIKNKSNSHLEATCVALTHCGNFVIVGYSTGDVQRFNIQSGIHRANYGNPAHKAAVRGLVSDNLNQYVISGCNDGLLKFWHFKSKTTEAFSAVQILQPQTVKKFGDGIALMRIHRESGMIAVVLVSFVIHIIDVDTKALIRKFEGHTAKINDVTFSPDSRWLISASMDSTVKVWDIPSSYMIDHFRVERPCVSLTMSPTGDFLATAHVGFLGIYLWANKSLFNQITLHSIDPYEPAPFVGLPSSTSTEIGLEDEMQNLTMDVDEGIDVGIGGEIINLQYETPAQLSEDLVTLSGLATSRWQNLLDLELIKKRNKPKEPPKVPKQAPFFLPTVAGLELKFDLSAETNSVNETNEDSRILKATSLNTLTQFAKLLVDKRIDGNEHFERCITYIKELGPSMIDFEIKSMHPLGGGSEEVMLIFLKMINYMLQSNFNFELAQSYLSVFLRAHGLGLLEFPEVLMELQRVAKSQENAWNRIEEGLMFGMGVVSALRNFVH